MRKALPDRQKRPRRGLNAAFLIFTAVFPAGCLGTQAPAPAVSYGLQQGGAGSAGMHTAEPGDTVWELAQRYRLPLQDIIRVNGLRPPYVLTPGRRVKLPPPAFYTAKPGDTLYRVSRTFGVGMDALTRQNGLAAPYTLTPGQVLRLPAAPLQPPGQVVFPPVAASSPATPSHASAPPRPVYDSQHPSPAAPAYYMPAQSADLSARGTGPAEIVRENLPPPSSLPQPQPQPQAVTRVNLLAAPPAATDVPQPSGRDGAPFLWPVEGPVLSGFGPKAGGLHNDGINIGAARGTPVRAANDGIVVYAGNQLKGFGNLILIRHEDRWVTAYAHLDRMQVEKGRRITAGQVIGAAGSTGSADRPQLHFEIRRGTDSLNPLLYLGKRRS